MFGGAARAHMAAACARRWEQQCCRFRLPTGSTSRRARSRPELCEFAPARGLCLFRVVAFPALSLCGCLQPVTWQVNCWCREGALRRRGPHAAGPAAGGPGPALRPQPGAGLAPDDAPARRWPGSCDLPASLRVSALSVSLSIHSFICQIPNCSNSYNTLR